MITAVPTQTEVRTANIPSGRASTTYYRPYSAPQRRQHPRGWHPGAIGVFAAVLSLAGSWSPSYWSDEIASLRAAQLPVPDLITFVGSKDAVHALYYFGMHFWVAIFGGSELSLRTVSAMAIGMAAAGIVTVGRQLRTPAIGVLAGTLFAILPRTTYMGAEARSYALTTAAAVCLTVILLRALRGRRLTDWLFYATIGALSITLFVYLALLIPVHGLFLVATGRRKSLMPWALSTVAMLLLATPILLIAFSQKGQISWLADQPVLNVWTAIVEPNFDSSWSCAAISIGIVLIAQTSFIRAKRNRGCPLPQTILLGVLWALLPVGLLVMADAVAGPLYLARYLSFCTPGLALVLAHSLMAISRRRIAIALGLAMVLSAAPTYITQREPHAKNGGAAFSELAEYMNFNSRSQDAVYFEGNGTGVQQPRLALYGYPTAFQKVADIALRKSFQTTGTFSDKTAPADELHFRLTAVNSIWVITPNSPQASSSPAIEVLTKDGFRMIKTDHLHDNDVYLLIK